ncbi:MAG: RNA polymerase sigma factor WhiG [Alkalispirochaeta sp.]|jgi:RNA polymerase sigma factor for flagellar operon FliA
MSESVLTEKTEEELWRLYRKTKEEAVRNRFVKQYLPLVKYVAGKLAVGMPQSVEFDDLVSYGVIGLFDAIEKFDPGKHVKFKTYAVTRIRGSIFDQLRQLDWVPRSIRQKARELEDTVRQLEAQLGRSATDQEIARELGLPAEDFEKLILKISGTTVLSLNDVWYSGEENDRMSIGDSIESPYSRNPDAIVEKQEMKRVIVEAIGNLPDREKKVLVLYYYENLTLKEIGAVLGVTESRISQLHTKAIVRLRGRLTSVKRGIM